MRYPFLWSWDATPGGGNAALVRHVVSPYDRDWYFRFQPASGGKGSVYVYDTRALIEASGNYLIRATSFTLGTGIVIPVTVLGPNASWDPRPMTITADVLIGASNGYTKALSYYVSDVETYLAQRIAAILTLYTGAHDQLGLLGVAPTSIGANPLTDEPSVTPSIDVFVNSGVVVDEFGNQAKEAQVGVTLRGYVDALPANDPYSGGAQTIQQALDLGAALRSIVDSQRTWGGLVSNTAMTGRLLLAKEDTASGARVSCTLPLTLLLPDWDPFDDGTDPLGSGGNYGWQSTQFATGGQSGGGGQNPGWRPPPPPYDPSGGG